MPKVKLNNNQLNFFKSRCRADCSLKILSKFFMIAESKSKSIKLSHEACICEKLNFFKLKISQK